eukprot:11223339-Lingulodinium_polyedra.AAC.1
MRSGSTGGTHGGARPPRFALQRPRRLAPAPKRARAARWTQTWLRVHSTCRRNTPSPRRHCPTPPTPPKNRRPRRPG